MRLFDFFKKRNSYENSTENVDLLEDGDLTELNKEKFYEFMQSYFEKGIVREVYSSNHICALALGERVYVACPYILLDGMPYGIYMNQNVLMKIAKNNREIYPLINEVFSNIELNSNLIFFFGNERIKFWQDWTDENKSVNEIDEAFEDELAKIARYTD